MRQEIQTSEHAVIDVSHRPLSNLLCQFSGRSLAVPRSSGSVWILLPTNWTSTVQRNYQWTNYSATTGAVMWSFIHCLHYCLHYLSFFIYLGLLYYLCFLANKDVHYCVTSNNMKLVHCNGCFLFLHRLLEKVTNLNEISDKIANKVLILTV